MSNIMTDKEYYADKEHITNTMLGWAIVGPLYLQTQIALMGIEQEDEPSYYIFGNAVHCKILEENEFPKRYFILSDKGPSNATQKKFCDMMVAHDNCKEASLKAAYKLSYSTDKLSDEVVLARAKDLYDKYENYIGQTKKSEGKIILSESDYNKILGIVYNVKANARAKDLLYNNSYTEVGNEKIILFESHKFGEDVSKFKSKIDRFIIDTENKKIILVDVKTHSIKFENTNFLESFSKAFNRLNYDRQLFMYSLAVYDYFIKNYPKEKIDGYTFEHKIVAIKSNYDNEVAVFNVPEKYLLSGEEKFKRALTHMRYYLQNPKTRIPYGANALGEETLIYE